MRFIILILSFLSITPHALAMVSASRALTSRPIIILHESPFVRNHSSKEIFPRKQLSGMILNRIEDSNCDKKCKWIIAAENCYTRNDATLIERLNKKYDPNLEQVMAVPAFERDGNSLVSLQGKNRRFFLKTWMALHLRMTSYRHSAEESIPILIDMEEIANKIGSTSIYDLFAESLREINLFIHIIPANAKMAREKLEQIRTEINYNAHMTISKLEAQGFTQIDFNTPILDLMTHSYIQKINTLLKWLYYDLSNEYVLRKIVDAKAITKYATTPRKIGYLAIAESKHSKNIEEAISQIENISFEEITLDSREAYRQLRQWIHYQEDDDY
jgi:hypothetical protein